MDPELHSSGNPTSSRGARSSNTQPKKVMELPSAQSQPELKRRSDNRWVRPSEVSKSGNDEELKTEELYRKVRRILNNLTPETFQTLTRQIIDLDIDTAERLEGLVDLIFEKAIDESAFSAAYANMCRCLIPKKIVVEKDGMKKDVTFRKILLNRCQNEFEKKKYIEKKIHEKLEDLIKQGLSEEELEIKKRELRDGEHVAKRRAVSNILFIGELFKLKMLTESIMHDCVVKLLKSNDEGSFECLCKLLVTIGKDLDHPKAKPRVDQHFHQIKRIIQARITSSRVRFMMQDIVDLRINDWVPRQEDNNPKTIDQIHKEAADKAKKTQMMIQMAKQDKKLQRGNMGGRDSPRPGSIPQADETWTTVGRGPRNVSVDLKKFQNIKRPVDSESTSLGPGSRGYGAWVRGSSGRTGAVGAGAGTSTTAAAETDNRPANRYSALAGERKLSAPARASSGDSRLQEPHSPISGGGRRGVGQFPQGERERVLEAVRAVTQPKRNTQERDGGRESPRPTPEAAPPAEAAVPGPAAAALVQDLTEEEMKKKTLSIVDEYLNIRDVKEAAECLRQLQSPSRHHTFVEVMLNHTMEKKVSDRHATGKLLHFLLRDGVLTDQQYLNGLEQIFEFAEDTTIDLPHLWKYLGELMGPAAFDGKLNLDELFKCILKYVSKRKAAKLFAYMLQSATSNTSQEDVAAILNRYNVTVIMFFDNEEEAREFAKDMNVEFALGRASSSTSQHSARIQEELRTIILKRKARNDDVFDWVDKNIPAADTKESQFIRALVTVVCEGAMDKEEGGVCKCNIDKLKDRKQLLQKYIDDSMSLGLQALYAVQALFVKLDHPPGFIKSCFNSLYDEEIITGESFHAWETSPDEEPGKGVTVIAASEFFRWLKSAPEENAEESSHSAQHAINSEYFNAGAVKELDESQDSVAEETTQTEEVLSDEETLNDEEVYLINDDKNDSTASLVGGCPFNEPIESEADKTKIIRSFEDCKRQKEALENLARRLVTSQKESKAKERNYKMKLQTLEKKLKDQEQDNVALKKALSVANESIANYKTQLETLVEDMVQSKAKEGKLKLKVQTLEKELRDQEQDNVELKKDISEANENIAIYKSQLEKARDWVISRDDIQVTNTYLGSGGYGFVLEGRYCGCAVAIKKPHYFLSPRERKSFKREMDIASRCRHPCLLQFIGATNDEENPLFVTELMETSLRKLLYEQPNEKLPDAEIAIISLDVARALNYLHQRKPTPIVHRDVSCANVLLWRRDKKWRGKLSDYGTARLVEEMMTRSAGAMIYSAPEAPTSSQTVKLDVYSFGVLLCEICIKESPDPDRRNEQVALMKNQEFKDLVERCLTVDPDRRPDMDKVIKTLEQFDDTS